MPDFSRKTIIELINAMQGQYNPPFDRTMLEFGLKDIVEDRSLPRKLNKLAEYLIKNPTATTPQGSNLRSSPKFCVKTELVKLPT